MSKKVKIKKKINTETEEVIQNQDDNISKKELYDLKKKEKEKEKKKEKEKNKQKIVKDKKKKKNNYQTNTLGRVFAIIMLILMVGSIIATISYYFTS